MSENTAAEKKEEVTPVTVEENNKIEETSKAEKVEVVRDAEEAAIFDEDEPPKKKRFRFNKQEDDHFSRDRWILERIPRENLMEYLRLEQSRMDKLQMAKERKWKRINTSIRLVASLIAGVVAVYFLKDEPTILVNILYICGILGGAWIWKTQKDKK